MRLRGPLSGGARDNTGMLVTKAEALKVGSLVRRVGLVEASKLLELHHACVARVASGEPVRARTARRVRERLGALSAERSAPGAPRSE